MVDLFAAAIFVQILEGVKKTQCCRFSVLVLPKLLSLQLG